MELLESKFFIKWDGSSRGRDFQHTHPLTSCQSFDVMHQCSTVAPLGETGFDKKRVQPVAFECDELCKLLFSSKTKTSRLCRCRLKLCSSSFEQMKAMSAGESSTEFRAITERMISF